MKFSEKLKTLRQEKGLTQQELAENLFVSRSAVAKWEQDRGLPSIDLLERLATFFDVSLDELIGEKEYRLMTIESSQKVRKHDRYNRAIIAVAGLFFLAFILLFVLIFNLKEDATLYRYQIYGLTERSETSLQIACEDYENDLFDGRQTLVFTQKELENIRFYDKYGDEITSQSLRTGYRVRLSFTSPNQKGIEDIEVDRIDVLDDFADGDYYAFGFFISTQEVTYDQPPIHNAGFGFTSFPEIAYEQNGIQYHVGFQFPYLLRSVNHFFQAGNIKNEGAQDPVKSAITGAVIKREYSYSVKVSDRVQTVYVYAVDNSDRGYTLVEELTAKNRNTCIEKGAFFTQGDHRKPWRQNEKIDVKYNLYVDFQKAISGVNLCEYDKNGQLVHETAFLNYESASMAKGGLMTQDETRYVRLHVNYENVTIPENYRYVRGDNIQVFLENKFGYAMDSTFRLY